MVRSKILYKQIVLGIYILMGMDHGLHAQTPALSSDDFKSLQTLEWALVEVSDSMYYSAIPEVRSSKIQSFVQLLKKALAYPNSFFYPFDSLGRKINIIYPDDKSFRIFNWSVAVSEVKIRYYGAIQMQAENIRLYGLVDYSPEIGKGLEDSLLSQGKWYGALYYRILPLDLGEEKGYTLLGMNAGGLTTNKKIVDILRFTDQGPVFGAPVFATPPQTPTGQAHRFIVEYKKGVAVSLNWNENQKALIYDRLISEVNDPNRKYSLVPSGQYDGLIWKDGKWRPAGEIMPITILKDGQKPEGERD